MLWWKFAKFLVSFLKAQVSFPSNVASIFGAIKNNSPILFLAQALCTLVSASFWDFRVVRSKFVKFSMSILNWQVNSSSNFASFFIAMTQNSPHAFSTLDKRMPSRSQFGDFKGSRENLPNSLCQFLEAQASFPSNAVSILSAIKRNSSVIC